MIQFRNENYSILPQGWPPLYCPGQEAVYITRISNVGEKSNVFYTLSNTVDKKRLESRSTQSKPGNPVSPRKGHPFIAPSLRSRKSEENRTAPARFPNGSLSLETSSINKRGANARPCKRNTQVFSSSWPGSQAPPSSKKEGGGRRKRGKRGGIAGGGGSRRTVFVVQEWDYNLSGPGPEGEITRMARTLDGARTRTVSLSKRNSRGRHYSVPPAILLAAATYWPRQHSFPARSANRCISPPIPICHCPRGPSLFSVRATGVPRIPVQISPIHLLRREASLPVLSPNDIFVLDFFFSPPSNFFTSVWDTASGQSFDLLRCLLTLEKMFRIYRDEKCVKKYFTWVLLRRVESRRFKSCRGNVFEFSEETRETDRRYVFKNQAASLRQTSQPPKKGNFSGSQEP